MKNYLKLLFGALCFSVISISASAQSTDGSSQVQTAVPFLRLSPEAQAGGMGDAALAVAPDANAVFWNSAKLPFADEDSGVALAYTPWLAGLNVDDIHLINAGGYMKTGNGNGAFNLAVRYFSLGETTFRESQFGVGVTDNPQEYAIQGGYSLKLGETTGLGVNAKYIHSDLASGYTSADGQIDTGQSIAADLNFFYDPVNTGIADWAFAAGITNLGGKMSYTSSSATKDFLPTNFGLGTSVDLSLNDLSTLTFALDANKLLVPTPDRLEGDPDRPLSTYKSDGVIEAIFSSWGDAPDGFSEEMKEVQISLGGQYDYNDKFFGRAGFFYEDADKGARQYATLGAGAKLPNIGTVNFARMFSTNNSNSPLDGTMRISFEFDIN